MEMGMKAVGQDRYGSSDVLEMRDVEQPTPGDGDVLVRIVAASVNPLDWHYMRGTPYFIRFQSGLRRPKQKYRPRGVDLAGVVEAVGAGVERFRVGDEVYGQRGGAFGEYKVVKESDVVRKPSNISFEEAAAIPVAATTALQALRDKGKVHPGDHVLVNGAGGGVGTFAVQIAKALGATVTAVCSTQSVDLVRTLGADAVVDYTTADFTTVAAPADVILDSVLSRPLSACRRALTANGRYVNVGSATMGNWIGPIAHWAKVWAAGVGRSQTMTSMLATTKVTDLEYLNTLIESGAVKPVVGRTYDLADVAAAVSYVEEGHARGKVVVRI
jgi:NADPH:quinone reductase-like Zn-dependent oxidoreductase